MVNEVINDILLTEKKADEIVEEAREQAKTKLAGLNDDIEKLYDDAEIRLKSAVEAVLKNAEQETAKAAAIQQVIVQKHIDNIMTKAEGKFAGAVNIVEKALR